MTSPVTQADVLEFQSENKNVKIKLKGNLQYDHNRYGDIFNADDNGSDKNLWFVRRSRLALKARVLQDWDYKIQWNLGLDSDRNNAKGGTVDTLYLRYNGLDNIRITVGQHKEPFGLENLTSSKDVTAIERSAPSQLFSPGKNIGATIQGQLAHVTWAVNYTDEGKDGDDDLARAYATRITYASKLDWGETRHPGMVHFGLAFMDRKESHRRAKVRPELRDVNSKARIRSSRFDADGFVAYGTEFAWVKQRFHWQAEYFGGRFTGVDGTPDYPIRGWYTQTGAFLSNDTRPYKFSSGDFSSVKPNTNWGAVEAFARYSETDLKHNNKGNSAKIITLGLNWYLNKYWRSAINLINANYENDVKGEYNGTAVAARVQFCF